MSVGRRSGAGKLAAAVADRSKAPRVGARGPPSSKDRFPVVGIGTSAGGLDACRKLLTVLPAEPGMAFILVQHLDPTHESMMVELLAGHTSMPVQQASDGMPLERDQFYLIPPGTYLSVVDGTLRLSQPLARHGARLPFDFLLRSMAEDCGSRAIAVILSGSGSDGSLASSTIKENGGLVIAQDPEEAEYDGMSRAAIDTGCVDNVLPIAKMPAVLAKHSRRLARRLARNDPAQDPVGDPLPDIIELLRANSGHDFRLYKRGTLQRRIERRMAVAGTPDGDMQSYLAQLRSDGNERDLLAKDLLINVTSFFRDAAVFDLLAEKFIPDLVREQKSDVPLRIWVAGCSSGEETYSLTILFREAIAAANSSVKLQVFASDVDTESIALAREGVYPDTIESDVSAERLRRFFSKEDRNYRVSTDLRSTITFTVQDLLADPPFSRIDMVSCRNLLIYLRPEAQSRVISLFHFALRQDGLLLLGNSETVGHLDTYFSPIAKAERLYRHVGRSRPGEIGFLIGSGDSVRAAPSPRPPRIASRQASLAELCRELVLETYAPAALLINRSNECLYSIGPTDRYLRVAPGQPTHDLFAMAREGMRTKLRSAIQRAVQENALVSVAGGRAKHDGVTVRFSIDVQPVLSDGEPLLLICFVEEPKRERLLSPALEEPDLPRVADLERELAATRVELQAAIRNLEISGEEQKAINEEALSANEEFQSTNEELLTSKEELQSLNEELTALNSQLQETLERQRTTSNDLQNVLYSTDIATLFLDRALQIRFFTPAIKSFFSIIPSDIGRPLADLNRLALDGALAADTKAVLQNLVPIEREIEAPGDHWFTRRILPYRTDVGGVEGVVITFTDITEAKQAGKALEAAKQQAELANVAKSRFLAAASHDLRQPLQTLTLVQALLQKTIGGDPARKLVDMLEPTLGAMTGMLNTLLDINQIDAGTIRAEVTDFPIAELFARLQTEFTYHAQAHGLELRVVPSSLSVVSDPALLEQMVRNLVSNAMKYTNSGRILLGCRRLGGTLRIEVWDTGIGIPQDELKAIFDEFHQVDNAARDRDRGLGLGLSIVQRLADLLRHRVSVRSWLGKGSVFSIEVARSAERPAREPQRSGGKSEDETTEPARHSGSILLIEDDPEVRELLQLFLENEGHHVASARDGSTALSLIAESGLRPDLILADYNLPNGMDGLQATAAVLERLQARIPVIILTGDISTETLRGIAQQEFLRLAKPVKVPELALVIQQLLAPSPYPVVDAQAPLVFVVDDDKQVRRALRVVLEDAGFTIEEARSCEQFLETYRPRAQACLLLDAYLPGMTGLELLRQLHERGHRLPTIMITGNSDVAIAVEAMKAGASDFLEKPIRREELLACIERVLLEWRDASELSASRDDAGRRIAGLTSRQREIMELVLAGHPSKNIAADLHISQRTVENHRALIMKKTGTRSLPALARLAVAASKESLEERAPYSE